MAQVISTPRSAAVRVVGAALRDTPGATSREAADVAVDALLAEPQVLHALAGATIQVELSPREREVAALVAEGLPNADIATQLGISKFTVSSFMRRIFAKLGVVSRAQMVRVLMERGLLK